MSPSYVITKLNKTRTSLKPARVNQHSPLVLFTFRALTFAFVAAFILAFILAFVIVLVTALFFFLSHGFLLQWCAYISTLAFWADRHRKYVR